MADRDPTGVPDPMAPRRDVGILGASGYGGGELMRYLSVHPGLVLGWATANRDAGKPVAEVFPNLRGFVEHSFITSSEAAERLDEVGIVFLSLPHHESQEVLPGLVDAYPDTIWVDLAGDFRTPDARGYERYYGRAHAAADLLDSFVYGLTEFERKRLRKARLIANPGCFATGILLALTPLAREGLLSGPVCLTGITGSSGSGRQPVPTTHHPERVNNLRAYKPLTHQHLLEVEWFLNTQTDNDFQLQFVPQSAPLPRGILVTVFLPGMDGSVIRQLYDGIYGDEVLVDVVDGSPELRWVLGTPRAVVGVDGASGRGAVVFVAIDNLGKGAAGQAIQNLNCALGWDETAGLRYPGAFV